MSRIRSTMSLFDQRHMRGAAVLAAALVCLTLGACGFQPVYGEKASVETTTEMASIKIDPIKERVGQLLRNHLLDNLNPRGEPSQVRYRLEVEVAESKGELAVRKSELATRSNMVLRAGYRLVDAKTGNPVMVLSSTVTASYNLLTNEFATLAAEADARERGTKELSEDITRQLALYFRSQNKAAQR
jgi:LPS-assembly lipoprotein